jgi:trimeric autotransporter adhesin
MRQLFSSLFTSPLGLLLISLVLLGLTVAGCGHSSTPSTPTTITISPSTSLSMNFTQVTELMATIDDQNGNALSNQPVTWTSSNANIATVTATGGNCGDTLNTTMTSCLCAGAWSSDFFYCKVPSNATAGTATITATSGNLSASITVLVHKPVARVTVAPSNVDCLSSKGTQQLTATAFDANGVDITSTVASDQSSFNWNSSDPTVVSIDTKGLATAVNPGQARVYASIAGTSSSIGTFVTCPVTSITLALSSGSGNTFSIAQAATQQLTPTVLDSNNNTITITSGRLRYNTSYGTAVSVNSNGLATGVNPGTSAIVASCGPPSCNSGLPPVFSNVIVGTTSGSTSTGTNSKSTQVIVASKSDTQLIPIDITTSTAGTALTLPYKPNSMIFSRASDVAYMGSDTEVMSYTSSTNSVAAVALIPGIIVDLSNDASRIVLYDDVTKTVVVFSLSSSTTIAKFAVPGATPSTVRASTSPDGQVTYVVVGNQLFVASSNQSLQTINLAAPANDVAFLLQGSFAYLAGGQTGAVTVRTTCDASQRDVVTVNATPDRVFSSTDGSKMFALASGILNTITASTNGAGCPPVLSDAATNVDLGQGAFTANQILSTTNGSKVYFITSAGKIIAWNTSGGAGSPVNISSGTPSTGGLTLDGANLWVGGGSDNKVHRIDTSSNTDAQQISVAISADLVAVKNQ